VGLVTVSLSFGSVAGLLPDPSTFPTTDQDLGLLRYPSMIPAGPSENNTKNTRVWKIMKHNVQALDTETSGTREWEATNYRQSEPQGPTSNGQHGDSAHSLHKNRRLTRQPVIAD